MSEGSGPRRRVLALVAREGPLAPIFESSAELRELLAARAFRTFWLARSISSLGDAFATIAVAFAVLQTTGSTAAVGYAVAARFIPTPLLVLAGGLIADRWSRLWTLVGADVLRLASQGLFAGLVIFGDPPLWQIVVLQVANGVGHTLAMPAAFGALPRTVPARLLQQANSLQYLSFSLSAVLGPAIGGVVIALVSPGFALAVDAASFGVSAVLMLSLRSIELSTPADRGSIWRDFTEGWRAVRSRTWLWLGIAQNATAGALYFACFSVLGPVVAVEALGGAAPWGLVAMSVGIGSVLGTFVAFSVRARRPLRLAFGVTLGLAPLIVLLALPASLFVLVVGGLVAGLAIQIFNALWTTALQENVPDELRSRVNSFNWLGSLVLRPAAFAVIGPVAATAGISSTLLVCGVALVPLALLPLAFADVRDLEPAASAEEAVGGIP